MNPKEKTATRLEAVKQGIKTSAMTDEELEALGRKLGVLDSPTPAPKEEEEELKTSRKIRRKQAAEDAKRKGDNAQAIPAPPPEAAIHDGVWVEEAPVTPAEGQQAIMNQMMQLMGQMGSSGGLSEEKVISLIAQHSQSSHHEIVVKTPQGDKEFKGMAHHLLPTLVKLIGTGEHVFMVGPASSGKTTAAENAAEVLGLDFYITGAILQKHELLGFIDAGGKYHTTPLRMAYEKGGLFLFDEIDASSANALVAFNALLANGLYTFPDATVSRHKDFVAVAAGNTYGLGANRQFVGRVQLDAATLDRFASLDWPIDEQMEHELAFIKYQEAGGSSDSRHIVKQWVNGIQAWRHSADRLGIRHVISARSSFRYVKFVAAGIDKDEAMNIALWKGLDIDQRKQIEAGVK